MMANRRYMLLPRDDRRDCRRSFGLRLGVCLDVDGLRTSQMHEPFPSVDLQSQTAVLQRIKNTLAKWACRELLGSTHSLVP
jgi:hypothetical protein